MFLTRFFLAVIFFRVLGGAGRLPRAPPKEFWLSPAPPPVIYFQQGILFVGLGCSISPYRKILSEKFNFFTPGKNFFEIFNLSTPKNAFWNFQYFYTWQQFFEYLISPHPERLVWLIQCFHTGKAFLKFSNLSTPENVVWKIQFLHTRAKVFGNFNPSTLGKNFFEIFNLSTLDKSFLKT